MALKALYSRVFLFHRVGCLVGGCGSRLHLSLGSSGQGVGFDRCDDDLLKFLQGVPDVPAFEDILWKTGDVTDCRIAYKETPERRFPQGSPFPET